MTTEIRVPTLGESVTEAIVGKWFKNAGDAVSVDEPLVELETDKVTVEVPAPIAGVLGEIKATEGTDGGRRCRAGRHQQRCRRGQGGCGAGRQACACGESRCRAASRNRQGCGACALQG